MFKFLPYMTTERTQLIAQINMMFMWIKITCSLTCARSSSNTDQLLLHVHTHRNAEGEGIDNVNTTIFIFRQNAYSVFHTLFPLFVFFISLALLLSFCCSGSVGKADTVVLCKDICL